MRPGPRRIQFHHPRKFGTRFRESLHHRKMKGEKCPSLCVDRVQFDGFAIEFESSIHVSACYLKVARCNQNVRISRGQGHCLAHGLSRRVPAKIEIGLNPRPGEQTVSQVRLDRQGSSDGIARSGQMSVEGFLSTFGGKSRKPEM